MQPRRLATTTITGSPKATARSAIVLSSAIGTNQPPAPSTSTDCRFFETERNHFSRAAIGIFRPSRRAASSGATGACNQTGLTSSMLSSSPPATRRISASSRSPEQMGLSAIVSSPARRSARASSAVTKVFPTPVSVPVINALIFLEQWIPERRPRGRAADGGLQRIAHRIRGRVPRFFRAAPRGHPPRQIPSAGRSW